MTLIKLASMAAPLCVAVLCWKHRGNLLWVYVLAGICSDFFSYWLEPKEIFGNIFLLVEFLLFSFFFRPMIFRSTPLFYFVILSLSTAYAVWLLNQSADKFQIGCASIFCMIYIGYSLFAYHHLLKSGYSEKYLLAQTTSIYVYASGCSLLFLFAGSVDRVFLTLLWSTVFIGLNIFHYVLIGIALYRKPIHGK